MNQLIKSYGEYWNPDAVPWRERRLPGDWNDATSTRTNNFWSAKGIYVLLADFRPVYVGQAAGSNSGIGPRVAAHLTDRLTARWDMFSWFSVQAPSKAGDGMNHGGGRHLDLETVVDTLEALAILIADPPLNRRRESLRDAVEVQQSSGDIRSIRAYLEEIVRNTTPEGDRA